MREYQATILFDQRLSDLARIAGRPTERSRRLRDGLRGRPVAYEAPHGVLLVGWPDGSLDAAAVSEMMGCRVVAVMAMVRGKAYSVIEAGVPDRRGRVWLEGQVNESGQPLPEESLLTGGDEGARHRELVGLLAGVDTSTWPNLRGVEVTAERRPRRWFGRTAS